MGPASPQAPLCPPMAVLLTPPLPEHPIRKRFDKKSIAPYESPVMATLLSAGPARGRWEVGCVLLGSQILFGLFGMLVPLAVLFPDAALPLVVSAELLQWVMVLV